MLKLGHFFGVLTKDRLLLLSFILFPFAMEPDGAKLEANKNALLGAGVILLTLAYLLSALYYVRWRRSIYLFNSLFLYDDLIFPMHFSTLDNH